jgi:uncharacterized cofD-like protein
MGGYRAVILGGGTGMSTVVGGSAQLAGWITDPFVGLKEEFGRLDVIVCTTDDGGSTGELLKHLPGIGIGDIRKSCLSLIRKDLLCSRYGLKEQTWAPVLSVIRQVFNYRFPQDEENLGMLRDPVLAADPDLRSACPGQLRRSLKTWGAYAARKRGGLGLNPAGHSMGNLLLTAAVFMQAGRTDRAPGLGAIRRGIDDVARAIGAQPGRLHAATSTPGQLRFLYANGVAVLGQRKAALVRRGCPVEAVRAEFAAEPRVSSALLKRIREADVIICAPGSLYSSMLPILQIRSVVEAIRANRSALKLLGANFWIQEGETDISLRNAGRGFLVSELIEAYVQNVPGGARGLFDLVLAANMDNMPGSVLRNYALEGKRPIHLDRDRVEEMGFQAVESTLFSLARHDPVQAIHHDPINFAAAVRVLLYARDRLPVLLERRPKDKSLRTRRRSTCSTGGVVIADYCSDVRRMLSEKTFTDGGLRMLMLEMISENRDIVPAHLRFFEGVRVLGAKDWNRSREWDNVLGYYDCRDRFIKVHEERLGDVTRLREDLLVALGESVLGVYTEEGYWVNDPSLEKVGARCYAIRLLKSSKRIGYLDDAGLRSYLRLARLVPDASDADTYRIVINNNEGFLPPGLLFGLMYAWYLNNNFGRALEYRMNLLQWLPSMLMPHQLKERERCRLLVRFFREQVFGIARL